MSLIVENSDEYFPKTYDRNYSNISELSDAKLRTEDGRIFSIHRCVLAKSNNYFYLLFCGTGRGSREIQIPGIKGEVLSNVLSYIYTGESSLTETNICDLLIAADYLLVDGLVLQIKENLTGNITINNCMPIFVAALHISEMGILRESFRFIQTHFEVLVLKEDSDIGELPVEVLKLFLCDKNLCVRDERAIWLAIVKWVEADVVCRQYQVPDLLMYLSVSDLDEQLATDILEHEIVVKNPCCQVICKSKLSNSCNSNLGIFIDYIQCHSKPFLPLYDRRFPKTLYFIAHYCCYNHTYGIQMYVTYDENIDLWRKITEIDMCPEFFICIDHNIYIFSTNDNRSISYNLWESQHVEIASVDRYNYGVVELDGLIYALGGICAHTGEEMNDVIKYYPHIDVWIHVSPMEPVVTFEAVSLDNCIYVVGTTPSVLGFEMLTQVYNPDSNAWRLIPSPSIFRYDFALIAYQGQLFVIGGKNEAEFLDSVEVYDPAKRRWETFAALPYFYCIPRAIVLNDQLFAYDNHQADRSYLKAKKPVKWNSMEDCWKPFENTSPLLDLHRYWFFSPDTTECIEMIWKENNDPMTTFIKSPFN